MGRNKPIWDYIARQLADIGYQRNGMQCRTKMDNIKTLYKKVKDSRNEKGRERKSFPCYDVVDRILGEKPAFSPEAKIATTKKGVVTRTSADVKKPDHAEHHLSSGSTSRSSSSPSPSPELASSSSTLNPSEDIVEQKPTAILNTGSNKRKRKAKESHLSQKAVLHTEFYMS